MIAKEKGVFMEDGKKLFVGLDVGTDSVGWAATDQDFNLLRLKGKTAWGARLFSAATSAKDRRQFRTSGRRLARRKERIRLLNTLFDPLISKKDPAFFLRLENSFLQNDDQLKPVEARTDCPLFISKDEEKRFYKKYPTIWHLRRDLMQNDDFAFSDIRFLYLAIHHIIKYRGNFLKTGEIKIGEFDKTCFDSFNDFCASFFETNLDDADEDEVLDFIGLPVEKYDHFIETLVDTSKNKDWSKKNRADALLSLLKYPSSAKPYFQMFTNLCTGGSFNTKSLNKKDEEALYEETKFQFDSSYDENEDGIRGILGDAFDFVEYAKTIFDFADLHEILGNSNNLSAAFVSIYESHKLQLSVLKKACHYIDKTHSFGPKESVFRMIFRDKDNPKNYAAFTHNETTQKRCTIADFNKFVVDTLTPYKEEVLNSGCVNKNEWSMLFGFAKDNKMLQTISIRSTSVIPMQLHKKELEKILDNANKRNIFGSKEITDKILALFEYKIPYYCGPLNTKSEYSNVVFKRQPNKNEELPWCYKDVVDFDATKKKFMDGLTNKCTYLKDCNVLPKESLLFQRFDALNKLNNLMINGERQPSLINELFAYVWTRPKTTLNDIKKYLKKKELCKENDIAISGWNPNDFINCSSSAALGKAFDLKNFDRYTNATVWDECEDIILIKAIFTDSPNDALEAIKKKYPALSAEQLKAIGSLRCKGWSTLSKEFLTIKGKAIDKNGEVLERPENIIDLLAEGKGNMMQVLNDERYGIKNAIEMHNDALFGKKTKKESVNELIESMPPQTRRPVIQAVRIVKEISKVAKRKDGPDVISIEVTRENNDAKKKSEKAKQAESRKKQLEGFLKGLANVKGASVEKSQASAVLKELNEIENLDKLRGKHLFLYFLQNGKDAYSGKAININDVLTGERYDTDHIIPQSMMKDDSIDNLVLVERTTNQHRQNEYPLPISIRNETNKAFWLRLKKAKMMSEKKYNNLIRGTKLAEEELSGFVAAQINVVNRSNVVIRDVLRILYPKAKLIFSKAQYPSQIRKELEIPKLRDLNDTHHAVDAYLNVVAGVKLTERFGNMAIIKMAQEDATKHSLNMERFISNAIYNDKEKKMTELGSLIDKTSRRHDFLLTYRFDYSDSAFYKQTLFSKNDVGGPLISTHDGIDSTKYGGYKSLFTEYNCIAYIKGKKKETRYLLGAPHVLMQSKLDKETIENQLIKMVPHKDGEAVFVDFQKPISLAVTVIKDGIEYLLKSSDSERVSIFLLTPTFISRDNQLYIKRLSAFAEKRKDTAVSEKAWSEEQDRFNTKRLVFNPEKSMEVLSELLSLAQNERFGFYSLITDLRTEKTRSALEKTISEGTLSEQLNCLLETLSRFTRTTKFKPVRKSRGLILQCDLKLVSKSITGLYETERKL